MSELSESPRSRWRGADGCWTKTSILLFWLCQAGCAGSSPVRVDDQPTPIRLAIGLTDGLSGESRAVIAREGVSAGRMQVLERPFELHFVEGVEDPIVRTVGTLATVEAVADGGGVQVASIPLTPDQSTAHVRRIIESLEAGGIAVRPRSLEAMNRWIAAPGAVPSPILSWEVEGGSASIQVGSSFDDEAPHILMWEWFQHRTP